MNRLRVLGGGASLLALAGYALGIVVAYPGRAFTIALLMVGVTLVAVGGTE
ncbi:hypothetical protein [Salinibaculum salinum]|uniref:hypothetical protein n=1 Tax=Salinibaculum salinum TaxID=3131996 RepID=UPI0030EC19ED